MLMISSLLSRGRRKLDKLPTRTLRAYRKLSQPCADPTPIFVVGCQRSGTSMVLGVFDRSPDATVYRGGDRRAFTPELLLRPEPAIRSLLAQSRTKVAVFKPMNQLQLCTDWLSAFPNVRIIWLLRSYQDVVNSCVRKFSSMRRSLARIAESPDDAGWWGENLSPESLEFVRTFYSPDMTLNDAYAVFWYIRNKFYFDLGLASIGSVRLFRYEDLVADPTNQFATMFSLCECPFEPSYTREVIATSVRRNPPPHLSTNLAEHCRALEQQLHGYTTSTPPL